MTAPNFHTENYKRYIILVSYSTPVAAYDKETGKYYRTKTHFSTTTTRHINKFLAGVNQALIELKDQSFFKEIY